MPRCVASSSRLEGETFLTIKVNGEQREVPEGATLQTLVELLELAPERLAVELNLEVVRRPDWPSRRLREGDSVEIVHFVGGGGADAL